VKYRGLDAVALCQLGQKLAERAASEAVEMVSAALQAQVG
jgi:hypothetical protein